MTKMPTVSVRLSDEDKRRLAKYGSLSDGIREAIRLYINSRKTRETLSRLEELQVADGVKTKPEDEARMIREDRKRR